MRRLAYLISGALALTAVAALADPGVQQRVIRQDNLWLPQNQLPQNQRQNVRHRGALQRNVLDDNAFDGIDGIDGVASPAIHTPHQGPITAAAITTAIEDATLFLRSRQTPDGRIGGDHYAEGGSTALAALALLAAGVDPISDPALHKALEWLLTLESDNTYVRGIRANVWEYALRKAPHEQRYRDTLERDLAWLLAARNHVAWRYGKDSTDWDNSCTQYAVLGLWAAERAGLTTGDAVWRRMSEHFRKTQNADGGWGYVMGSGSSANMATAGLASLYLVFDHAYGRKAAWRRGKPAPFREGDAAAVLGAIDRGLTWLAQAEGDRSNAYYLYGIERAAVAGGQRLLGGVDWFAEGADAALRAQRRDGAFPLGYSDEIGTALTTLFLVYGGAPPAFAKLRLPGDGHNLNPRDVANLTQRMWEAYERPLNWHVVSVDDRAEDFEAPILFVTGHEAVELTDAQVANLRRYIERGGTILAEPADGSPAFRASMVALLARLFPPAEYPDVELAPLPADHAVYGIVRHDWKAPPRLSGAGDGVRTFFFLSDDYLAADWQTDRVESDAFPLAMNLLFYATDLRPLAGRFAVDLPPGEPAPARDGKVRVARARHGATRDWAAAAPTWERLAPYVAHATGLTLVEDAPVDLAALGAERPVELLHLTGRRALALTPAEREGLRRFVDAGGTVLVDAWGGSPAFAAAARAELEALFGPLAPLADADPLATGLFDGGADLGRDLRYRLAARRDLRARGRAADAQQLEVIRHGGRPAIVFSRYDLAAAIAGVDVYGGLGYAPSAARRVATNLVAWIGR
ncbi:MAG: DUF4159 domain-containing protein [Myxococcales bacterium]|nr:DUF4159 domain-containing protein [Myxococcales bacterium]